MLKRLLTLIVLLALTLPSCAIARKDVYQVTLEDSTYIVDTINKTIKHEDQVYRYEIDGDTVKLTYPDNAWIQVDDMISMGNLRDDFDEGNMFLHVHWLRF